VVLIIEDGRLMIINPDGVQHMIRILQEGMNKEEGKKVDKKNIQKNQKKGQKKSEK
jgi:hypothetical protein